MPGSLRLKRTRLLTFCVAFLLLNGIKAQESPYLQLNKPDRLEWLQDAGFGMFIHFSFDSQLGMVISHSMVGASQDYLDRFINELPKTFNPEAFNPGKIARLARLAGMKYVVLTAKHHSGFCLWDTETTDFNIMNTAYAKDLLKDYVEAVRKEGLGVGLYFSPEDFHFLYANGQTIRRRFPEPLPEGFMKKYLQHTERQCRELMTNYGKIDVLFFDGGEGSLQEKAKEVCWSLQPDVLVTRGAMSTPEQTIPGMASSEPFEACITMGTQWQYKPTNDMYKSGARLIQLLIETRAKGGALLLNVGPKPAGDLPIEQEERLREIAAWYFINHEAVDGVRPWVMTNENTYWFTRSKDGRSVYAFLTTLDDWPRGERKTIAIRSVRATDKTEINVLGQSGEVVEYQPDVDGALYWEQKEEMLEISVVRAQRIYNNHKWHNPIVLKLENVSPALMAPRIETLQGEIRSGDLALSGQVSNIDTDTGVEVGFEYRMFAGFAESLYNDLWNSTEFIMLGEEGKYSLIVKGLLQGKTYEYRAVVKINGIKMRGEISTFDWK